MKKQTEIIGIQIYKLYTYGQLIFEELSGQFTGERKFFSINYTGIPGYPYEKKNINPLQYTKHNLKWIIDIKAQTLKLLK